MAITQVNICNQALVFLGEKTIISLDDNTRQGELCTTFFDTTRDTLLRAHPWNFALKAKALTLDTATPYGEEWDYQYLIPSDMLRMLKTEPVKTPYTIRGNRILSTISDLGAHYIYSNTDYLSWTPDFAQLLAARLAVLMSHTITEKSGLMDRAMKWYDLTEKMTKGIESQEGSLETIDSDDLLNARWRGVSSTHVKDTLS